jgi:stage V sporulation protein B
MMGKQSFVKGALILTAASILVKVVGAGFRIVLAAIIGDEGIGLYQMAYPVFSALLAVSTAGIPIAISKLISQHTTRGDYRGAYRVFLLALNILSLTGLVITALMVLGAGYIAENIAKDARAYYPIVAIAPAIFFVTIMATFRGFFQGQQKMYPTALSQIFEQVARVAAALGLVYYLGPRRLEWAAAGASFGAAAGAMAGLGVLMVLFGRERQDFIQRMREQATYRARRTMAVYYDIFSLSIPITLSHLVMPIISLIDMTVVPMRLAEAGFDEARRMALYGQLTGMAAPLVHIPQIVTIALAVSLVPAISEALALHNRSLIASRASLALRLSVLLGLPSAVGLFVLAEPISLLLYQNREAGIPLAILAFTVIFIAIFQVCSGILQGLGKTKLPLINLLVGSLFKIFFNWHLIALPALNIRGAAAASVIGFAVAALLNLFQVWRLTEVRLSLLQLSKPVFAVVFMGLGVHLAYAYSHPRFLTLGNLTAGTANALATFLAIGLGIAAYGLALLILGALSREDLLLLPGVGPRLLGLLSRFRLLRD